MRSGEVGTVFPVPRITCTMTPRVEPMTSVVRPKRMLSFGMPNEPNPSALPRLTTNHHQP